MKYGILVHTTIDILEQLFNEEREQEYLRCIENHFRPLGRVRTINLMEDPLKLVSAFPERHRNRTFLGKLADARQFMLEYTTEKQYFESRLQWSGDEDSVFLVHSSLSGADQSNVYRIMKSKMNMCRTLLISKNGKTNSADFNIVACVSNKPDTHLDMILDTIDWRLPSFIDRIRYESQHPTQMTLF